MLESAFNLRGWAHCLYKGGEQGSESSPAAGSLPAPELPYKSNVLKPILSKKTIEAHLRIHKGYVDKTRELVRGTDMEKESLQEVAVRAYQDDKNGDLARNACQAWNHAFYWLSISPPGQDTAPTGTLLEAVNESYGSVEECRAQMVDTASKAFGSAWLWLVQDGESLGILTTPNAKTPLVDALRPLLCIDLWEHAYFLEYESDRKSYIDSSVKQLLNWGFADKHWKAQKDF